MMKKLVLSAAFMMVAGSLLNATNTEEKVVEFGKSHQYCKAQALSIAYTVAHFYEDGEPRVSDFVEAYKSCRGFN